MKSFIIIYIGAILVFSSTAGGQPGISGGKLSHIKKESLGIKGGVNFSKWVVSGQAAPNNQSFVTRLNGGILYYRSLPNPRLALLGELTLTRRGSREKGFDPHEYISFSFKYNVNYATIALFLLSTINENHYSQIFIEGGLEYGIITSKTGEWELNGGSYGSGTEDLINIAKNELGLVLGVGSIIQELFIFEARYNIGLSNLYVGNEFDLNIYTRSLYLQIGILISVLP